MIRTVIFDFDGTIADTTEIVIQGFNEFADKFKLPKVGRENITELKNYSARELMKKYQISPIKVLKMANVIRGHLNNNIQNAPVCKGMDKLIKELKKRGIKILGIVTSNSKENVDEFLKRNDMQVDFVHGEKNIFGKGKKLIKLIKRLKLNASEVLYVGDEVRDIEAAREAGIKVASVTWGFNSEERLLAASPDFLIKSPEELFAYITPSLTSSGHPS